MVVYDVFVTVTDAEDDFSMKVSYESLSKRPEVSQIQELRYAARDSFHHFFNIEADRVEHRVKSRVMKVKSHAS